MPVLFGESALEPLVLRCLAGMGARVVANEESASCSEKLPARRTCQIGNASRPTTRARVGIANYPQDDPGGARIPRRAALPVDTVSGV